MKYSIIPTSTWIGLIIGVAISICVLTVPRPLIAATDDTSVLDTLLTQLDQAKTDEEVTLCLESLKGYYIEKDRFDDFAGVLTSFKKQKKQWRGYVDYYLAVLRTAELKHLEEVQDWNAYFSRKDTLRAEVERDMHQAIASSKQGEALSVLSRLFLWSYYKDAQDIGAPEALVSLLSACQAYAKETKYFSPLKTCADTLASSGEISSARAVYALFVDGLLKANSSAQEVERLAQDFLREGNLALSQTLYDVLFARARQGKDKEREVLLLEQVAKQFAYTSGRAHADPAYAENVLSELESIVGKDAFSQELAYVRAFNLEKMRQFADARIWFDRYSQAFPAGVHAQEAIFKTALIDAYVLGEIAQGEREFAQLAQLEEASPWKVSALYQLGLLAQWQGNTVTAGEFYTRCIASGVNTHQDVCESARQRMAEIEKGAPIAYALKTYLEVALGKRAIETSTAGSVSLESDPGKQALFGKVSLLAQAPAFETGCMSVEVSYLWSGDLGSAQPSDVDYSFESAYVSAGTKVVNVVVVSPSGIVDYGFTTVDIR